MIVHQKVKNWNSRHGAVATVIATFMVGAIVALGGLSTAFLITNLVTQPESGGMSAIETIFEAVKEVAEDVGPGLKNVTKFVQENGAVFVGTVVMDQNKG